MSGTIRAEKMGATGLITFDHRERHNAMSLEMWQETVRVLADFAHDDSVRVVVLTGAGGKAFVAGADISKFGDERATQAAVERYNEATEAAFAAIGNFTKPTIAKIRGYCLGGGLALALGCDLRLCNETARFSIPAAKLGIGYTYAGVKRLLDVVGPSFTKEIFLTARQFDADEALAMGLVNRVLPDDALDGFVANYAEIIAANAPLTLAAAKAATTDLLKDEASRDRAFCETLVARCFDSRDYREGRTAFMEKRKPVFTGK